MDTLIAILQDLWEGLISPFYYFISPEKRVNLIYLLSSALLAYYVYQKTKSNIPFYKYLFSKKIWLSKSAFVDYKYFFFNGIIKLILILPIIESWRYIGVHTTFYLEESLSLVKTGLNENQVIVLYAFSVVITYDFVFYCVHWAMHKIPFLWEFHKIHHSATTLNPITQHRLHPVELIINNLSFVLVSSVLKGVFDYYSEGSIDLVIYAEVNLFSLLFLFWGANLRHSHVKLKYFNFLENFIISPRQHQIHHSNNPKHFNKNIGAKLALWDRFFGTLIHSKEEKNLHFGLGKIESKKYERFIYSLVLPFKNIVLSIFRRRDSRG